MAAQNTPVWMYEFRDQTAIPSIGVDNGKYYLSFPQGAAHSDDLQYLYTLRDLGNDERRRLQAAMSGCWTNFARTGDPDKGSPDKVLGLDVASGGGVQPLASFDADRKCAAPWNAVTF